MPINHKVSAKHVNVIKQIKVDGQWLFAPVVMEADGQVKDRVRIGDRIEVHSEGTYFLEWRENGKRLRRAVSDNAQF